MPPTAPAQGSLLAESAMAVSCQRDRTEVTTQAVQLHGGYGYTREFSGRTDMDAKITEIYEISEN